MIIRRTTPEESNRVNELFAIAFEQPLAQCPADPGNPKLHHWAAFEDNNKTMMSTFTVSDYQIQFDGHRCKMGGIGGVATLPQYRRQGGIRGCFAAALPQLYKEGYDFSYLYPFSTRYYRKFGYECCVQKLSWTVDPAQLDLPTEKGAVRLAELDAPLTDAIVSLDRQWEEMYNMMVMHNDTDYQWTRKAIPAKSQEFTYVYFDCLNFPKAYTTFRLVNEPDGRNLVCSRFCFVDAEGFYGLMGLFKSMSSDHTYVKFQTPWNSAVQYLISEWSLGAVKWSVLSNAGMVRVIHAKQVLEKARYKGSGCITLQLLDPQIEENNRTFRVEFSHGRALCVDETTDTADARIKIPAFSALISGVCDFSSALQCLDGLDVLNPDACYDQVFYRKMLMITDYF